MVVGRAERAMRYNTWAFYLPTDASQKRWIRCLREVVDTGKAHLLVEEMSASRVDVTWPTKVTFQSAFRLIMLAQKRDASFRILGAPVGIASPETAASVEASPQGQPVEQGPSKRRRITSKTLPTHFTLLISTKV